MSKQHPVVGEMRSLLRWHRKVAAPSMCPDEMDVERVLDWAISVCEAADNLVNVKGRHHAELAYRRLEEAVNG